MKIFNTTVFSRPTALHETCTKLCETWTLTAKIKRMLLASESKCYRRIMGIK